MDPFDDVRAEPDPLRRAQRAGELLTRYQQRSVELARLRKEAINTLLAGGSMSSVEIARQLGLSKGRVTQIRQTAPTRERDFFGVGPVTIAVPLRTMPGRGMPVIASEDARARDDLRELLERQLAFQVAAYSIPTDGRWTPSGDVVAICGPKSSEVTAMAIGSDPVLGFGQDQQGRWVITSRSTGEVFESPMDSNGHDDLADIGYLGRLNYGDRSILVVAGVHALGSVGVVDYLRKHLDELYEAVSTHRFSAVIGSTHSEDHVRSSWVVFPPCVHE